MPPPDAMIDDALDGLVNQFADPLACLRELVQNAIDAGSPEVEIRIEREPGARGDRDLVTLEVEDFGEGMDRRLIDERLTRLFSSSKQGDLTKIGRFGIGFVSVFALLPEAVCLDTSRAAESWRILFREDRSFERIALDQPVDGTRVRIFKALPPEEVPDFIERARTAVAHWCKHASAEVRFGGELINQPLAVDALCTVHHVEQGTEVVAGFCPEASGRYGFYNRGLTLLEGPGEGTGQQKVLFPHVAFKIDSRYLEHTLTRDQVRLDASFDKAMTIVEGLVRTELPARLMQLLANPEPGANPTQRDALFAALGAWLRRQRQTGHDQQVAATVRELGEHRIFRSPAAEPISLAACVDADRDGRLFYARSPSLLTERLAAAGHVVVGCAHDSPVYVALRELRGNRPRRANACFCTARAAEPDAAAAFAPLGRALAQILRGARWRPRAVRLGHLAYTGSSVAGRAAITQRRLGELTDVDRASELGGSLFGRRLLVLNADHPSVECLIRLAVKEPELAAYGAAKLFFLTSELHPELDSALASRAVALRCRRQTA